LLEQKVSANDPVSSKLLGSLLGLDFIKSLFCQLHSKIDDAIDYVLPRTMSSSGFVTMLDLQTVTFAASAPLGAFGVLQCTVAPEPQDIKWEMFL